LKASAVLDVLGDQLANHTEACRRSLTALLISTGGAARELVLTALLLSRV